MTNNHVKKSLMGTYKIRDMIVDIYFSPKVIETYASDEEIYKLNNIKDFQKADDIRNRLNEMGIEIEDTADGTVWSSK